MRYEVALLFALLSGACSIYDQTVGNGSAGSAGALPGGAGTGGAGRGGEGGTDIGASGGGGSGGAETGDTTGGGGGAGGIATTGSAGAGGSGLSGSGGAAGATAAGGASGSTVSAGAGGSGGNAGAGGSTGVGGSAGNGAGGTLVKPDGGNDATPDVGGNGAVCAPGTCKRVFVSLVSPALNGKLGGITAVDTFCQTSADARQLGGMWKAWISDTTSSPSTRFTHPTVPYRLLDGSTIAANYTALTSGTLTHVINVHEDGTTPPAGTVYEVWTGTLPNGTYSGNACANWTNDTASAPTADVGVTSQASASWSDIYQQFCDRTTLRVYCFEQ